MATTRPDEHQQRLDLHVVPDAVVAHQIWAMLMLIWPEVLHRPSHLHLPGASHPPAHNTQPLMYALLSLPILPSLPPPSLPYIPR